MDRNFCAEGTPDPIVQQLAKSVREAMESPEVKTRFDQTGSLFRPLFTNEFARFIEDEQRLWWPVAKEIGPK